MKFHQLACNYVMRNTRVYLGYFLSSVFTVIIFFAFELLAFHPQLGQMLASTHEFVREIATEYFRIAQYLIIFFSFFFILYSVSAFLKKRKREFGILILHGMTNSQLKQLILLENLVIGSSSIIVGIGIGLIFGKFILIIGASLFLLKGGLPFYFPAKAILVTCFSFFMLFLLVSLFSTRIIKLSQVMELMKSEEKPKSEPKVSKWLALFSILFISIGYAAIVSLVIIALRTEYGPAYSFNAVMMKLSEDYVYICVMLICIFFSVLGTYFLFTQLSFYLLKTVKKREHIFFKKTNLLTISELAYRITDNARTLFFVTILSTVTFTSIGYFLTKGSISLEVPQSPVAFEYTSNERDTSEKSHVSEMKKQLNAAGFSYKLVAFTYRTTDQWVMFMKLSDYNAHAKMLGYPAETLKNEQESLILLSESKLDRLIQDELKRDKPTLLAGDIHIQVSNSKFVLNNFMARSFGFKANLVVADSVYEKLSRSQLRENITEYSSYRFFIKNWTDTEDVSKKLMKIFSSGRQTGETSYAFYSLYLAQMGREQERAILYTISILVGIVFFVFALSFLYFRQFTDFERDKKQYEMLSKIGLTQIEFKRIVTQQMSIIFFIPIIVAIIHSTVALMALQYFFQRMAISFTGNFMLVFTGFIFVQLIYFLIIRRNYLRQIFQSIHGNSLETKRE
ncbi:hypothetical protein IIU_05978 [Bacillus cereus VD133]|uniref:ABC3 transporter permease C-terminal domain-containing protein n=1 Tax=Bacillus cereus VD133 TaxID=1053233 RepID=A0A9W5PL47_BACCE|nr:FtsX-like permease family protein [Bacillus cereus]EOO26868.1 hypothetical protein IIU_05978 [Bacillus cereus VD133]